MMFYIPWEAGWDSPALPTTSGYTEFQAPSLRRLEKPWGRIHREGVTRRELCRLLPALCLWGARDLFAASGSGAGKVFPTGPERIELGSWASARSMRLNWQRSAERFEVLGQGTRGNFSGEIDSRKITIRGVVCYLSYPIALMDERLWIATGDLAKVMMPLLFPAGRGARGPGSSLATVCVDPGHGGKDPGNRHFGLLEKELTLKLALTLKPLLEKSRFRVVLTRKSDRYLEPEIRPVLARKAGADILVSLHFNAVPRIGAEVRGVETYALTPAGHPSTNERVASTRTGYSGNRHDAANVRLAFELQRGLVRTLGAEDRGVKRQRFAVLREAPVPAVLVEGGFLSDYRESRLISQPAYLLRMAEAIRDGLLAFVG
ncbi:MAG: N-acetylmuramoyl-L-alanine amidase [Verrucomicrobia bacterium]|nr:N-acetylmuramoyl-L-alanine amidase [Verrucomicrobiota bacterium]